MPARTWYWGRDEQAYAAVTAHVANWPAAAAKQIDPFTAQLANQPGQAPSATAPAAAAAQPAPAPAPAAAGIEDDDQAAERFGELLGDAAELVIATQHASTGMLQRKLRLSHQDRLRVLEALERHGVIGERQAGQDTRQVLVAVEDPGAVELVNELRDAGDAPSQYMRTPDPSPEITAGPYDEITEPTLTEDRFHVDQPADTAQLDPEQARALIHQWIRDRAADGNPTFTGADLVEVRKRAGYTSRGWLRKVLEPLTERGVLTEKRVGQAITYTIADADADALNADLVPA